jgi:osmoprotectant transport system ATP-binding protein
MFQFSAVSKQYGSQWAVDCVDLTFLPAQTTVLLGTSGCGKSTLLRLALGLVTPTHGDVLWQGEKVNQNQWLSLRRKVGYVIQRGGLFPHITAYENVALVAKYLHWSRAKIAQRVTELADWMQLPQDLLNRPPAGMSGGQQQRVALMRALMLDPEVLLLDEPLGALDPIVRADMQTELRETFRKLSKTVVLVTHDLREAQYFADRVVLMRSGRVVQEGAYREFVEQPADPFVTKFIEAQAFEVAG